MTWQNMKNSRCNYSRKEKARGSLNWEVTKEYQERLESTAKTWEELLVQTMIKSLRMQVIIKIKIRPMQLAVDQERGKIIIK
jgi:hypothetical protein